jgi:DNA-binding response OmpR family regulator
MDKAGIRILYVEDDETLSYLTRDNLELIGYSVTHVGNGLDALAIFKENNFDLCIIDIMLPAMDGYTLTEEIRKINKEIPILFLTARLLDEDRIKGFKTGADDYITKPFSIKELSLRIEVFFKRRKIFEDNTSGVISISNSRFDYSNLVIHCNSKEINLTQREGELLKYFISNKNKVLKRDEILKDIWGDDDYFLGRSLDVFVSRLRKMVKDDPGIVFENIHGVGFRLKEIPIKDKVL